MAKYVEFDGNKIGVDKQFKLMDTGRNVKKTAEALKVNIGEIGDDDMVWDVALKNAEQVAQFVCKILDLTAEQKKRIMNLEFSMSDESKFFEDCTEQFLGLATSEGDTDTSEDEDPKLLEDE